MSQLDETQPGGIYLDVQGNYRNAWGVLIQPPGEQPPAAETTPNPEPDAKKNSGDGKTKKTKETTNE